jgi:DNA-binding response OmpR family regulator
LPEGMNGVELAEWTLRNRPGVRVLITTGGASRADDLQAMGPILAKPYTGRDLLDRVKQTLAKRSEDKASAP